MTGLSPETVGKLTYAVGDAVIISHSHLYDEHIVAMIDARPTRSTVMVRAWLQHREEWSDEPKRRKLDAIVGKVNGGAAQVAARLVSASAELNASRRRAEVAYGRTIRALAAGDRP